MKHSPLGGQACNNNFSQMKKLLTALFILLSLPLLLLNAQTDELKETFLEAESYFLFEEYRDALGLYVKIHRAEPENDNINYRIGVCLLNDPYQKEKSIRYLEIASQNINPRYKENNFKEWSAPLEVFYYLGKAYLVNNQIEKALENYEHFLEILDPKIYNVELVKEQIKICNTASNLMKLPVDYDIKSLPSTINTRFTDKNPIISGDGQKMIFVSELRFYDAAYFAEKVDGVWQPPRNIVPDLGVDGDVYPTFLSFDGTEMIIYRNDNFIGNLYSSKYIDGRWGAMTKLGGNINTKYWESHGSMNKDGNILYFTSNRKGGFGGLDIYESKKQDDGSWGDPVNLGKTVNSRYNEETPFITENGQYLYFSSYGHFNMGGYDVFYSKKKPDGQWDTPINMGYPINTTDDDLFYYPVDNGLSAYFSVIPEEGQGLHDISFLDIYSDNNPRMYMVTGYLKQSKNTLTINDDVKILLIDRVTGDTVDMAYPDLSLQKFTVKAPRGIYNLIVKSNSYDDVSRELDITTESDKTGIILEKKLVLETVEYIPQLLTGDDNIIELSLTDEKGDISKQTILIYKEEKEKEEEEGKEEEPDTIIHSVVTASEVFQVTNDQDSTNTSSEISLNETESEKIISATESEVEKPDPEIKIKKTNGIPSIVTVGGGLVFTGFIFFLILLLWKRKKKKEE